MNKFVEIAKSWIASMNPTDEQKEIAELIADRKQKLKINLEKVSFLAQREFTKNLFFNSSYNRVIEEKDYDDISREEIVDFHKNKYLKGLFTVVLVGDFSESELVKFEDVLGPLSVSELPEFTDSIIPL